MISPKIIVCCYLKRFVMVVRSLLGKSSKLDVWTSSLMQLWSEPMNRKIAASKGVLLVSMSIKKNVTSHP